MKSSQEMMTEILELESKLASINQGIARTRASIEKAKANHARLIEANLENQKHKPKFMSPQRRELLELDKALEGYEATRINLEAKLDQAKTRLDLARLHESLIPLFEETELGFTDNLKVIELAIDAINNNLHSLAKTIDIFMQEAGNPLDAIESLIKNPMLAGLSFKGFIDGEIKQAKPNENDDFLQAIGRKYLELANRLPRLKSIEDSWTLLSNKLDNLARQAQGLIPSRLKYHHSPQPRQRPKLEHGTTVRIPSKPPARKLNWAEKKAREERRAAALFR